MSQKLILPVNKCLVTASYKTVAYKARFGFSHYGADMVSFSGRNTVYASGDGLVLATGADSLLGNVVVVRYNSVVNHKTGAIQDVIARYYHLHEIITRAGAQITSDSQLALYGNTGKYSAGAHLHIEFDTNTTQPRASKTISRSSNIILASAADSSVDPCQLLHCKSSPPDCQEIRTSPSQYRGGYYALPEYAAIPTVT